MVASVVRNSSSGALTLASNQHLPTTPQKRFVAEAILLLVAACLFTSLSIYFGWFSALDRLLYDSFVSRHNAPMRQDIVIVGIDDSSLHTRGLWPWAT